MGNLGLVAHTESDAGGLLKVGVRLGLYRETLSQIHRQAEKHVCNPRSWELETGGSGVQGQPWLHIELEASLS